MPRSRRTRRRITGCKGKVTLTEALGSEIMVHFSIEASQAATEEMRELAKDVGDERVVAQLEEGGAPTAAFVGRFGARSRVKIGDEVVVAVDSRALHFFDPQTGLGIYDAPRRKELHDPHTHRGSLCC